MCERIDDSGFFLIFFRGGGWRGGEGGFAIK